MFNNFYFKQRALHKTMWKNTVQPARPQMICYMYEGRSEINASYFIMLAHDVRGEYC